MIEAAYNGACELFHEIWDVDEEREKPAAARSVGRIADRLSNVGTVLIYGVLVAYAVSTLYRAAPLEFQQGYGLLRKNWWFWVGLVLVMVTALRFGLEITKTLKRWNIASLLGSLLLFDLVLKQAPPIFGAAGLSPIDSLFGFLGDGELGEMLRKAVGL